MCFEAFNYLILFWFILWLWWIALMNVCKSPTAQQNRNFYGMSFIVYIIWSKYYLVYLSQMYVHIDILPQRLLVKLLESDCVILWARMQWLSAIYVLAWGCMHISAHPRLAVMYSRWVLIITNYHCNLIVIQH